MKNQNEALKFGGEAAQFSQDADCIVLMKITNKGEVKCRFEDCNLLQLSYLKECLGVQIRTMMNSTGERSDHGAADC